MAQERKILKDERLQRGRDFNRQRLIASELFPDDHPYHWMGDEDDVDDVRLPQVQWFFQRWYRPDNATLVLVGDVVPAEAEALVRRYFEPVVSRGGAPPHRAAPSVTLDRERRVIVQEDRRNHELIMTWLGPTKEEPGGPELGLVAQCLANGYSSFAQALMTQGHAIGLSVSQIELDAQSLFLLDVVVPPNIDVATLVPLVDAELASLRVTLTAYCHPMALRGQARVRALLAAKDFAARATHLAEHGESIDAMATRLDRVSKDSVSSALYRYLTPNRVVVEAQENRRVPTGGYGEFVQ